MALLISNKKARLHHAVVLPLALAYALSGAVSLFGQLPTGTILGSVRDSTGAIIPGVTVTARNTATGLVRTTVSNEDGGYRFPALPVGSYEVRAEQSGFKTNVQSGVTLTVGQEAVLNFALQVGAAAETVEVTEQAPLVNTTSGTLSGLVNEDKIQDLPLNGRNYLDLSLMQLGVTQQRGSLGTAASGATGTLYSSTGAPARSNSYLLDGAVMANISGASAASVANTSLGLSGTREFKVVTNSFSAEYGLTMGSVLTIVSKGGTNTFHGEAYEFLRNSAMDAANFFDSTPVVQPGSRIAPLRRNQFGGGIGGPIQKDKTFFYATYEGLIQRAGRPLIVNDFPVNCFDPTTHTLLVAGNPCATSTLPGAPPVGTVAPVVRPFLQLYPYPNLPNNRFGYIFSNPIDESYGQIRLDHNFSAGDSVFVRYTIDHTRTNVPINWPQTANSLRSQPQFLTLSQTHIFSPVLVNNARFSFSRTILDNLGIIPPMPGVTSVSGLGLSSAYCSHVEGPCISNNTIPGTSYICSPVYGPVTGNPPTGPGCLQMGGLNITGVTSFSTDIGGSPTHHAQNIFTFSNDTFYSRGSHAIKFGALINRYQQNLLSLGAFDDGSLTFLSIPNFFAGLVGSGFFTDPAHNNAVEYRRYFTVGFYVQDDIKLARNLTVNLGLRYEFNTYPVEARGNQAAMLHPSCLINCDGGKLDTPSSYVLGPSFQDASYRNFGPRVGFAWDIFGNGRTALRAGAARLFDIANMGTTFVNAIGQPPFIQTVTFAAPPVANQIAGMPLTLPLQAPPNYQPSPNIINYYLKQPQMYQWNLSIERQLPGNQALTIAYAGSRGLHLLSHLDGNPKAPLPGSLTTWALPGHRLYTPSHMNPNLSSVEMRSTRGDSHYNALQVGLTKQLSHGLQFQSSYTWSKSIDDFQAQGGAEGIVGNSLNLALDRGPSVFDITHNWRFNLTYRVPSIRQGTLVGKIFGGWGVSALESLSTGYPINVVMSGNPSGSGMNTSGTDRPNLNPNFHGTLYPRTVARWFDPAAFISPPPINTPDGPVGVWGNVGRFTLRGPGFANLDSALIRELPVHALGDAGKAQFRFEVYNIFNHPNFALPASTAAYNGTSTAGTAGQFTSTVGTYGSPGDSRRIQIALKVLF